MHYNDNDINLLLNKVLKKRNIDFARYNPEMIKRRVAIRLAATRTKTYGDYAKILDANPDEYKKLLDDLTINVSHFFRNPLTFELIDKIVLPDLISFKQKKGDNMIRVWCAGCSTGEEPYSMAILLLELLGKQIKNYNVTIYATDIDNEVLRKAKIGEYQEDSILKVKKGLLDKYFYYDGSYKIKEVVKEQVDFSYHDLSSERSVAPTRSVFANFDLILCRNVIIYFSKELQEDVLNNFKCTLNKEGYLVLGEVETLPDDMQDNFVCIDNYNNIYQIK